MSDAPQNYEANLRASVREHMRSQEPASGPVSETPVETATETPQEPTTTEVAPAAPTENPSEVAAAPEAPEESPSSEQPSPASDAPTPSAIEALSKRGFNVTDEKLAADYLRIESEFAAMKRAEKAAQKAQPVTETQPVTQQTAPEPTPPVAQPTPVVAPAPVPPAQTAPSGDLDTQVRTLVASDPDYVAYTEAINAKDAEIKALVQYDQAGRISGGKYAELGQSIAQLRQLLNAPELAKAHGLEFADLDPLTKADYKSRILALQVEQQQVYRDAQDLAGQRASYAQTANGIAQAYKERVEQQVATVRAEADFNAEVNTRTETFMRSWNTAKASAFQSLGVAEKLQPKLAKRMETAAKALDRNLEPTEMLSFMEQVIKDEIEFGDTYHSQKQADYARLKRDDVQAATQAPSGPAAVATPAKTDTPDWEKALRAQSRQVFSTR